MAGIFGAGYGNVIRKTWWAGSTAAPTAVGVDNVPVRKQYPLQTYQHRHQHTTPMTPSSAAFIHTPSSPKPTRYNGLPTPLTRVSKITHRFIHAPVHRHCCDVVLVQHAGEIVRVADVGAERNPPARTSKVR